MGLVTDRRTFLRSGVLAAGAVAFGPAFWRDAFAATAQPGPGPYGPLQPADANGVELPAGFSSRIVARANLPVENTSYVWHQFPDGQATYATPDGGWILVSNSEIPDAFPKQGGASAIRFDRDGNVVDAYRILSGTTNNCSGGATPWGTWLSCEETDHGLVWECDPAGGGRQVSHPAMGAFDHESAAVDPKHGRVYLSEDDGGGGFYRYTPRAWPDLSQGRLEIAERGADGAVAWHRVPDPSAALTQCRDQVATATRFRRGEGLWFDSGVVYLATTGDNSVWAYDTGTETMEKIYDGVALGDAAPLLNVDNVTVSRSGDLFVCEDPGQIGIGIITPDRVVARFLRVSGPGHRVPQGPPEDIQNEVTGVVFDPSGTRMYFSAQRSFGFGVIFEITGPFRT